MQKIKTNSITIAYQIQGSGTPVIFVPGFNCDHLVWENIVADYEKKYQVILLDLRGSGQSDCPDYPYTIDMMADDIIGLMQELHLKKAYFIGISMGCAVLQTLAIKRPDLMHATVLVNGFRKIDIRFALFAKAKIEWLKKGISPQSIIEATLGWGFSSKFLQKQNIPEFIEAMLDNPYSMTAMGYQHQLAALTAFDSTNWLQQIQVPTLVIGSTLDMIVAEKEFAEMAEQLPNSRYFCFKEVGHMPYIEEPQLFNDIVMPFLENQQKK